MWNKVPIARSAVIPSSIKFISRRKDTTIYIGIDVARDKHDCFIIINATKYVCHWGPTFAAYLAKKRAEGKRYNVAISHAAKKLVRLIYALEKTGQTYPNLINSFLSAVMTLLWYAFSHI